MPGAGRRALRPPREQQAARRVTAAAMKVSHCARTRTARQAWNAGIRQKQEQQRGRPAGASPAEAAAERDKQRGGRAPRQRSARPTTASFAHTARSSA